MGVYPTNQALWKNLILKEDFKDTESVRKNGFTITDTVTFSGGVCDFDGSTGRLTAVSKNLYNIDGDFSCSCWIKTSAAAGVIISKWLAGTNNRCWGWRVFAGKHDLYLSSTGANYENENSIVSVDDGIEHHIGFSYNSTTSVVTFYTDGVLNGTKTYSTTTGPPFVGTAEMMIGDDEGGTLGGNFNGEMKELKMWKRQLSAEEFSDLYHNSTFNFKNKADLYLDFKSLSGTTLTDKSGNGRDFTTSGAQTTFKAPGMDFGSDSVIGNTSSAGTFNNTNQTIVVCFEPDFEADDGSIRYIYDSATGRYLVVKNNSNQLTVYMGGTSIATLATADFQDYWNVDGLNVIVVAGTTGNTDVWLNGFKLVDADNTAWSPANPSSIYIGSVWTGATGNNFDGSFYHFSAYPIKFSETQARKITKDLFREYS